MGQWNGQGKRRGRSLVGVSQVLEGILDRAGLGHLFYEEKLRGNWIGLMGPKAAEMATLESLKGWTLKIKVESAVWRHELSYQRETLRKRANQILGGDLVKDVMLV